MEVSTNELEQAEPLIIDHGDGTPTPAENDEAVEAAAEGDVQAAEQPAQSDPSDEQTRLALTRGWVEEEKYRGKGKWVDAAAYNQRYDQIMPVVTRENRRMREEMRARDTELANMRAEMGDLRKHYQEQQDASRTIQVQTLLAQKAQAESEGDWQTANTIGDKLLDMKLEQKIALPRQKQQQPQQLSPAVKLLVDDFVADNPIFAEDEKKTYLALAAKQLVEAGTPKIGRELLDEAAELAQQLFPTKFKQAQRRPAMAEMNGVPSRAANAVRTWADLKPDEAKKQDQFLTDNFPKADAKTMNGLRQKLVKELPTTAFRR